MTRTLILMRHAKSSWDSPGQRDHARPLNARGRRSAKAMGDWLREVGQVPDQILCSSAARTRETCALLGFDVAADFMDALYHAEPDAMLQALRGATGERVLMIGHNPGIAELAQDLVTAPPAHPRFFDYPTCATLIVTFDAQGWSGVTRGTVQDFMVPRDLLE